MRTIIFLLTLISLQACKANPKEHSTNIDTDTTSVYISSTRELESNEIPKSVFEMTNLKVLSVSGMDCDYREMDDQGNDITRCWALGEIPKEISKLKKLESLRLNVNNIQSLPKEITELKLLKSLDLSDNTGLSNIDFVTSLENLEELSLYGCYLESLPKDMAKLKKLKYLGLAGNNISSEEKARLMRELPDCDIKF